MNYPGKQEFADCKTIAADIITEICNRNPPDFINKVNNRPRIGSLNTVHLSVVGVPGDFSAKYDELEKLSAEVLSNAIIIHCPFNNARVVYAKTGNRDHLSSLERAIYGAIVHECTHLFQAKNSPDEYEKTKDAQKESEAKEDADPNYWLDSYYSFKFEQGAHAAQAAAEVEYLIGAKQTRTAFDQAFVKTEVYRRIHSRMPPSTGSQISHWWGEWQGMACEIYNTL